MSTQRSAVIIIDKEKKSTQTTETTISIPYALTPTISHTSTTSATAAEKSSKSSNLTTSSEPPYTIFSHAERYVLVYLTSTIAIWSSLGSPIYYPALQIIRSDFHVSEEMVNLSIVVYMLCQGIAPSIMAPFADKFGRRVVLLMSLLGFISASVGLALVNNYTGLLILRCVQSSFISPSVPISSGVVGDFTTRANRGGFVLLSGAITFLGQAFGAVIGAILIHVWNWRAIFWFLALAGLVVFIQGLIFLPETRRSMVGNGTILPQFSWCSKALILNIPKIKRKWRLDNPDLETLEPRSKLDFLSPFKILMCPELAICLLNGAIHYSIWVVLLTCLTGTLSSSPYNYSVMMIGICYIPAGIGGLIGALLAGRVLNYVYQIQFKHHQEKIEEGVIAHETKFNIVRARVTVIIPYALFTELFCVMYGWCLHFHSHIYWILISEFLVCLGSLALIGINSSLLIDLYPHNSSAASSAVNLTRCSAGALFVAVLKTMQDSMKMGGVFTFMAGLGMLSTVALYVPMNWGMVWAERRRLKQSSKN